MLAGVGCSRLIGEGIVRRRALLGDTWVAGVTDVRVEDQSMRGKDLGGEGVGVRNGGFCA